MRLLAGWPPGWLAAWLAGRLAGWPPGRLAAWLGGRLAGWPPGRLATWLAGWLAGCLAGWLPGWLAAWLAGRLAGRVVYLSTDCERSFPHTNTDSKFHSPSNRYRVLQVNMSTRGWQLAVARGHRDVERGEGGAEGVARTYVPFACRYRGASFLNQAKCASVKWKIHSGFVFLGFFYVAKTMLYFFVNFVAKFKRPWYRARSGRRAILLKRRRLRGGRAPSSRRAPLPATSPFRPKQPRLRRRRPSHACPAQAGRALPSPAEKGLSCSVQTLPASQTCPLAASRVAHDLVPRHLMK